MSVLHPTLLAAGLAAVALPILIHLLLRRRYTPVRWAAMRFIMAAHKQQRRRRKLEQIVLLIARCLVIALIALAVARPLVGPAAAERERTVVLIIDNGLASSTRNPDESTDLDRSLAMALAEIDRLRPAMGDRVSVVTAGSPPRAVIAAPTGDLDTARRRIEAIEPEDSAPDIAGAFELANAGLDDTAEGVSFVIVSGWRRGTLDTLGKAGDLGQDLATLTAIGDSVVGNGLGDGPGTGPGTGPASILAASPAENERANLRILSVEIPRRVLLVGDTPAVRQAVVRIDRTGPATVAATGEIVCSLSMSTPPPPGTASVSVPFVIPEGSRETLVAIELPDVRRASETGHTATIAAFEVRTDPMFDTIKHDSRRLIGVRLADAVDAGVIRSRGIQDDGAGIPAEAWIGAALHPDESTPVRTREIAHGGLDAASLIGLDLVVLARPDLLAPGGWDAIAGFVDAGGTLLLFTPPIDGAQIWTEDAAARVPGLRGIALEATATTVDEGLIPGDASAALGLLGAELADLAGAVRVSRSLPVTAEPSRIVLSTESGTPVVVQMSDRVWLVSTALAPSWSDIAARPLFPALVQEIARQSPSRGVSLTSLAGEPVALPAGVTQIAPVTSGPAGSPQESRRLGSRDAALGVRNAGPFQAIGPAGEPLGTIAVNADANAGDTAVVSRETAGARLRDSFPSGVAWLDGDERTSPADIRRDRGLGFWAFAAAALFAVIESLIAFSAGRRNTLGVGRNDTKRSGGAARNHTGREYANPQNNDRSASKGAAA